MMTSAEIRPPRFEDYFGAYAPGVYLQEQFSRPGGAEFATGIPAFLGLAQPGSKLNAPVLLTLWFHFKQYLGEPQPGSYLGYAVRGFFENGGQACYVVPLAANTPAALASGLAAIAHLNTIDLVCAPDAGSNAAAFSAMQQLIVDHCQKMQDRFAILDAARGVDADKVWQQWSDIDGANGALYYPWIKVAGFKDEVVTVPPCGHVAGVYARTDKSRGVHKAPANEVLEEVIDLEIGISNATQASLNAKRINCIRSFPGRGIRIWGARTLSGHDRWTYVNVRRLFLTTARWIDWNMQYVPFEPNDSRLWTRVERDLRDYLYGLYRLGALKGETPQEAFYVRCNAETNTPESRDRGEVVAQIGLAPAVPYEFIVVRLIRGEKGVRISEAGQSAQNL